MSLAGMRPLSSEYGRRSSIRSPSAFPSFSCLITYVPARLLLDREVGLDRKHLDESVQVFLNRLIATPTPMSSVVDCFSCPMVCDESDRNTSGTEMAFFVPEKRARHTSGTRKAPHLWNGNEGNA